MLAESDRITGLFIFAVIFSGVFGILIFTMPSELASSSSVRVETPSSLWRTADLFLTNMTDTVNVTFAHDTWTAFGLSGISGDVYYVWYTNPIDTFYFEHRWGGWWIFSNRDSLSPSFVSEDEIIDAFDPTDNSSRFAFSCKHNDFEIVFYYNQTLYDNISQAVSVDALFAYVGVGVEKVASSVSAWSVVSSILFFNAPNIHPALNAVIAIPLWAIIGIVVYTLFLKLLPFVG